MYCRNCGKEIDNLAVICVGCGVPVSKGYKFCNHCGSETSPEAVICIQCGRSLGVVAATPVGDKSRLAAGLLGIFLGWLGVHRFYLGYIGIGIAQIAVTMVTCGFGGLWGFIEGILIIANAAIDKDAQGRSLRE